MQLSDLTARCQFAWMRGCVVDSAVWMSEFTDRQLPVGLARHGLRPMYRHVRSLSRQFLYMLDCRLFLRFMSWDTRQRFDRFVVMYTLLGHVCCVAVLYMSLMSDMLICMLLDCQIALLRLRQGYVTVTLSVQCRRLRFVACTLVHQLLRQDHVRLRQSTVLTVVVRRRRVATYSLRAVVSSSCASAILGLCADMFVGCAVCVCVQARCCAHVCGYASDRISRSDILAAGSSLRRSLSSDGSHVWLSYVIRIRQCVGLLYTVVSCATYRPDLLLLSVCSVCVGYVWQIRHAAHVCLYAHGWMARCCADRRAHADADVYVSSEWIRAHVVRAGCRSVRFAGIRTVRADTEMRQRMPSVCDALQQYRQIRARARSSDRARSLRACARG